VRRPTALAIETATEVCGAAVADRDGVRAEALVRSGLSHSSRLVALIERVTADAGVELQGLDVLGVSVGPGSFTGIRIGMGMALGIAAGAGLPVVGVPTLDALAWSQLPFSGLVCPFIDARRGEVYYCVYEASGNEMKRTRDYAVLPPAAMIEDVSGVAALGAGALLLAGPVSVLESAGVSSGVPEGAITACPERCYPSPGSLAALALRLHSGGQSGDVELLRPIYVRRSDAELKGAG
jgi:tRNA threonylcarbamoyladenosine biosynthesis protein TsaB